jgi:RimJ/RimL family protein N-acetyltransferase
VAHNVSCWVDDWNKPGLTFAAHHGFRDVGRIRRSGIRGGHFHDTVCLDILRPEWREREGR